MMNKIAVGQHHFISSFLPSLISVLLASSLVLLGFGIKMDHTMEQLARSMAQRVNPGSQIELELDLAVGEFAMATVLSAHTGDESAIFEASERLDSAARAYDGWAHALKVESFADVVPFVDAFEQRIVAANPRGSEINAGEVESALVQMHDFLRVNRRIVAGGASHTLDKIAALQHKRRWEEMVLMALVGGGCVALMFAARRREQRVCADEVKTVRSLQQTNADLEAFAGRVAHDLRNPLVPILSGSQVIERSNVDAQVKRAAARIERSARRLSSMIDMLLDFSRLTATPPPRGCEVAPIVEDVVEGFRDKASAHGVTLVVDCDEVSAACEPIVVASPLQNLIENAFKYGRRADHEPIIEVRGFERAGMVIIEVEDRGPGIDAGGAENLFRAFKRGVDGGEGVGLGLATARRLVEARGGSIGLRAGRFGGALFQIRLPAERPPEEPLPSDEEVTVPGYPT
jgi:signal transduction histidine kinase